MGQSAQRGDRLESVRRRLLVIAVFLVAIWLLEVLDFFVEQNLDLLGIHPKKAWGVPGIFLAPLLHGGFAHLTTNTTALLPLVFFVAARREHDLYVVTAVVVVAGGLGVWAFGQPGSVHIGASSLVFGYIGYLMALGWFERSAGAIGIAALVLALYGSLLLGLVPGQPGVSWESHFFGFSTGAVSGWALSGAAERREAALVSHS